MRRAARCWGTCCHNLWFAAAAQPTPLPCFSPVCPAVLQYDAGDVLLQRLADDCLAREGVLVARARYSRLERRRPPPSIRCAVEGGGRVCGKLGVLEKMPGTACKAWLRACAHPPAQPTLNVLPCARPASLQGGGDGAAHRGGPEKGGGSHQGVSQAGAGIMSWAATADMRLATAAEVGGSDMRCVLPAPAPAAGSSRAIPLFNLVH